MTDHDAIAARVRQDRMSGTMLTGPVYIKLADMADAYLDLYDEAKRLRAERDDAISTLDAWFDRRELVHDAVDQAVLDCAKGYLRTSRVGGMQQEESDTVLAVIEDMARLSVFADLFIRMDRERLEKTEAERDRLRAALDDIAAAAFWIANEIHIGPEDEGRDIYDMALAIRDDASAALKGPEE